MQTIMDAASHIAEEIERTRLHLTNLEQALAALKPLITIDVSSTTLFYNQVGENQSVEDAFIVQEDKTTSKAAKPGKVQAAQAKTSSATAGTQAGTKPKGWPKSKVGEAASKTPADKSPAEAVTDVNAADELAPAAVTQGVAESAESEAPQQAKAASLPATGAEFWLKSVGRKAFSSGELTQAALKKLSLDASTKPVMANRARAWITASLKKGVLVAAGMRNGIHFYKLA